MGRLSVIGIIIQARMGSTRLPGKVLKTVGGRTLLGHILFRLSFLRHHVKIILATSTSDKDDVIESFSRDNNIVCFRGSEDNVLERYYLCAVEYGFQHIVRLTADNPFYDIEELDNLIDLHLRIGADYSHSFAFLPYGTGAEIFTFDALAKSYKMGHKPNHIEHVNEYITDNPELFKIEVLSVPRCKNRPDIRLTIDTQEDYENACKIAEKFGDEYFGVETIIKLFGNFSFRTTSAKIKGDYYE
jgi:spore coat polysaccharide biosynthesis protein SpsF